MSDRLKRKDIKHDKFIEDVGLAYGFAGRHRKALTAAVIGIVVVVAGIWGFFIWQNAREDRAQARLAEAIAIFQAPVGDAAQLQTTQPVYASEEEKIAKATPILQEIVDDYGMTDAADVAKLYLARIAVSRGDIASARPALEELAREKSSPVISAGARIALLQLEMEESPQEAIARLEKEVADQTSVVPKDAALSLLAQAYERVNDPAKARATYQRLVNEYPDSPYAIDAQNKLMAS